MKIAVFNVENLFNRTKLDNGNNKQQRQDLARFVELNTLLEQPLYSASDKQRIGRLLSGFGLAKSDRARQVILRQNRNKLVQRPKSGGLNVVADGRGDWVGWLDPVVQPVNDASLHNAARVVRDINPDVIAIIEAEDRNALIHFGRHIVKRVGGEPYDNMLLMEGNSRLGFNTGIMTRAGFNVSMLASRSHHRTSDDQAIFEHGCCEYKIETPNGEQFWFLLNHYSGEVDADPAAAMAKRTNQATHVAECYGHLKSQGAGNIVIMGDLNTAPDSPPLGHLLQETDLRDVGEHGSFDTGTYAGTGTFGAGTCSDKRDYILVSPLLFTRIRTSGLFRRGAWPGDRQPKWPVYDELKRQSHAASRHHAIWVEID